MRILFLSHYFFPESNAPAVRVHQLCKRWVKCGCEVTVITCAPNVPSGVVYDGYRNSICRRDVVDGIDVIRVWTYLAANRGTARRIGNYLSYMLSAVAAGLCVRRPDVLIATSPQFFCGWAGVILGRIRRVPFILEIRDIWPDSIVAVGAMTDRRALQALYRLEKRMYNAAARIVTVGKGYQQELMAKGVPREHISIVPNGVDRDLFRPEERDEETERTRGAEDLFTCAYVGTIGMACGLDVVLEAAKMLRDEGRTNVRFLLVGDGARLTELQGKAREANLDNVVFTGRVPRDTVPGILAASDACLIHLRRKKLFRTVLPSKIFEAAAMAKPIILGVEGSAAEIVRNAGAGICIEPENPAQLACAVKTLAANRQLAKSMGKSGHAYVTTHYDRDVLSQDYLHTLREAI